MSERTEFSRVQRLGLRLADVEIGRSYGAPALKVRGRMFACIPTYRSAEPGSLAVRMSNVERDLRMHHRPDIYYVEPHYEPHPVLIRETLDWLDRSLGPVRWGCDRPAPLTPP